MRINKPRSFFLIGAILFAVVFFFTIQNNFFSQSNNTTSKMFPSFQKPTAIPTITIPKSKTLSSSYHIFQTFNNCGPAALSMALSYYGINISQDELGKSLRPYQVASGVNDDKTVLLSELAEKSKEYGFIPYYRPNGSIKLIRAFIANDIPIIAKTWTKENEDIGHYRIIKGYDDAASQIIQDDSLQGKNLRYSYDSFNKLWEKFNFEYVVLVPLEKQAIAEEILSGNLDEKKAWTNALERAKETLQNNPNDPYARFNLSIAYYHIGEYQKSVEEFEKVETRLPFRTLWYQIEPIQAYYELGNYDRVFEITDKILNNQNLAFSELYMIRGNIYLKQGDKVAAKQEFDKAVLYNKNLKAAQEALSQLSS